MDNLNLRKPKRFFLWASRLILQAEILIWLAVVPLVILFGTAHPLKKFLAQADVYGQIPDIILKQSTAGESAATAEDIEVQKLVKDVFTKEQLKTYGEDFIDGMYRWLNGEVAKPDFIIDLTGAREKIVEGVADRAVVRLAGLPACTGLPTGSLDPFVIECLPPGIDISREKERLKNEVMANEDFLQTPVLTADQLPKGADGRSFTETAKDAPGIFQLFTRLPWIIAGVGCVTAAAMIWLDRTKRDGIRNVGRLIMANGSFVLVATLLFGLLLPKSSEALGAHFISSEAPPLVNNLFQIILQATTRSLLISSGVLVVIGGVILLANLLIKIKQTPETPPTIPELDLRKTSEDPGLLKVDK